MRVLVTTVGKSLKRLPLLMVQPGWHFDVEFRVQIANAAPVHLRQPLAAKAEYLAGRRARRDLQHGAPLQGRDLDLAAEGRPGKADRHAAKKIGAFALENLV